MPAPPADASRASIDAVSAPVRSATRTYSRRPFFLRRRSADAHRQRDQRLRRGAREPQQQRPHHAHERHEHRDRIARQPDERGCAARNDAHRDRPSRLDRDAPEHEPADRLDGVAHVVGLAGRDAARGEHEIVARRQPRRARAASVSRSSRRMPRSVTSAPSRASSPAQQIAVRVVESRRRRQRRARLDDLVAGREQRDPHASPHRDRVAARAPPPARDPAAAEPAAAPAARPLRVARPRRQGAGSRRA